MLITALVILLIKLGLLGLVRKTFLILLFTVSYTAVEAQNFYKPMAIREVRLNFPNDDWDKFLDSAKRAKSEARLNGTMLVDGQRFEPVGVRYKGNSSYYGTRKRGLRKMPFNIKLAKGQLIEGKYNTLKLSNVNKDASFIREVLTYEIIRTYMVAPEANYAKVFLNDKLMGFYNSVESIDEHFIKNHFSLLPELRQNGENARQKSKPYLIKCDPEWQVEIPASCPKGDKASLMYQGEDSTCYMPIYEMDKDGSWREFIQFLKILNQEPDKLERVLNVDQTLWMLALNNVLLNLDSYTGLLSHNYYLLRGYDGRFLPIMWDVNLSLGGFTSESSEKMPPLSIEQMQTYQPLKDLDNPKRPLISQILKNTTYRKIYIAHIRTILNDWFLNGQFAQRARELATFIDAQVNADKNKHYSYDEFKKNLTETVGSGDSKIVGIEELMVKRIEFLKNHPLILRQSPKFEAAPSVTLSDDKMTIKLKIMGAARAFCCVRANAASPYAYLPMYDDGKHNDEATGDGIFSIVLDKKAGLQYYIMAENEEAVSLYPERAGFSCLTYP